MMTCDVTEVEKSESRCREVFDNVSDCLFILDVTEAGEFLIVEFNPAEEETVGLKTRDHSGQNILDVLPDEVVRPLVENYRRCIRAGHIIQYDETIRLPVGIRHFHTTLIPMRNNGGRIHRILGVSRDVTKERGLERELSRTQRIESLGTLAGGVAHDFNNILGIVLMHTSLIERSAHDPVKRARSLQAIQTITTRGRNLVQQLLTFASKADLVLSPIAPCEVLQEAITLVKETFPKLIRIRTSCPSTGLPAIKADRTQMLQIILNLCSNARDAMVPQGGLLHLSARAVHREEITRTRLRGSAPRFLEISVTDTGHGMEDATKARAFEPFFTTKPHGSGTGLGLSTVHGIVERHGGSICLESAQGKGTALFVYIPLEEKEAVPVQVEIPKEPGSVRGTILVVEDEDLLLSATVGLLESEGYEVLTARDGLEGLSTYRIRQHQISLVLSDVGLPLLSGDQLFRIARKIDGSARVILMSGNMDPDEKMELLRAGVKNIISKPFSGEALLEAVRAAL
ncbi:MAG: response regulator [Spirochaetia bacterium]|nr:response regulator [Spirochaetia bacterium]